MKIAFLAIPILCTLASSVHGAVNTNLLQCTQGSFLTSCNIAANTLAGEHTVEREYSVTYTLPCSGPVTTFFLSQ